MQSCSASSSQKEKPYYVLGLPDMLSRTCESASCVTLRALFLELRCLNTSLIRMEQDLYNH